MFFWWLNIVRLDSLHKILYSKRRIESYSIMGTIVSPKVGNNPLIHLTDPQAPRVMAASFQHKIFLGNPRKLHISGNGQPSRMEWVAKKISTHTTRPRINQRVTRELVKV